MTWGVFLWYNLIVKKLKRELMPARLKKAKKTLELLSHTYIRKRDAINKETLRGYCFDCGLVAEGKDFQCGHWIPSGSGGAVLRYHPLNMHGQRSACNCGYNQEMVKIQYTRRMEVVHGKEVCDKLLALKNKTIKADIIFYENMIQLYECGIESLIIVYLETL